LGKDAQRTAVISPFIRTSVYANGCNKMTQVKASIVLETFRKDSLQSEPSLKRANLAKGSVAIRRSGIK